MAFSTVHGNGKFGGAREICVGTRSLTSQGPNHLTNAGETIPSPPAFWGEGQGEGGDSPQFDNEDPHGNRCNRIDDALTPKLE
jgi:hypothetical protein